jgi:hypothetical protein
MKELPRRHLKRIPRSKDKTAHRSGERSTPRLAAASKNGCGPRIQEPLERCHATLLIDIHCEWII